jgi:DNA-binding PadR family transcriptional regulator
MPSSRFPIPQGTLDMLLLQILSLGPAHGYGIAQRLEQISRSVVQVNQGSLYPALHRLEQKGWLRPNGNNRRPAGRPSSIPLHPPVAAGLLLRSIAGRASQVPSA